MCKHDLTKKIDPQGKDNENRRNATTKHGKTGKNNEKRQRNSEKTSKRVLKHALTKKTINSWTVQARRQSRGRSAGWLAGRPAGRNNENSDEHRTKNNEIQQIRTSDHEKTDGDTDSDNENQQNCKNG